MSKECNNIPGDQGSFSDFFQASLGTDDVSYNGLDFPPNQHDMNHAYNQNLLNQRHEPTFPIYTTQNDKGSTSCAIPYSDDNVFPTIHQQSFTQVTTVNGGVTYQPQPQYSMQSNSNHCTNGHISNAHIPNQTNYEGYLHSSSPDSGDRASVSNSPYTPTVRQDISVSPPMSNPTPPNSKSCPIPSVSDYPGDYSFEIYFGDHTESAVKNAQYTYSSILRKLFVKMNALCPIQFRCMKQPAMGSFIRALPVYTRPEHVTDVVTRCPNHYHQDSNTDQVASHLIRAEQPGNNFVQYLTAPDGRESVIIGYTPPEVGAEYITVFYTFMCLSSCAGGINRRPIMTIFTLESPEGTVLARRCVEVRVCSCPGRDRSQEERRKRKPGFTFLPKKKKPSSMPSTSSVDPENGDKLVFFLRIHGKEKYEILKKIKEALDLKEFVSQEQKEEYEQREATEKEIAMQQILSNYFKKGDGDSNGPFPT